MDHHARFVLKSSSHTLEDVALHDATLVELRVDLLQGSATLSLLLLGGLRASLAFQAVQHIEIAREHPWGPSESVNALREAGANAFEVEMQSGDVHRFKAGGWEFSVQAATVTGAM